MLKYLSYCSISVILFVLFSNCGGDDPVMPVVGDLEDIPYSPQAYDLLTPDNFPQLFIPADNPLTVSGVELGRHLFYDPILSVDSTMSCSSCHLQSAGFTDNLPVSPGVDDINGRRSAMSLVDVGFHTEGFFWDGRSATLEDQALLPVEDPIELHDSWPNVVIKFQQHDDYPRRFREAFGIDRTTEITKDLAVKAIAQFERSIVSSGQAKYDRVVNGLDVFTDQELLGHNIFFDIESDISRHAECGHCHNAPLFTINDFANNGIEDTDLTLLDEGRAEVTGISLDLGAFKIPTLRNIFFTGPYMHDGRFGTLDEVIDHYTTGGHPAINLDPVLRKLSLSDEDRGALIAFIKTLEDPQVLNDPRYSSPF